MKTKYTRLLSITGIALVSSGFQANAQTPTEISVSFDQSIRSWEPDNSLTTYPWLGVEHQIQNEIDYISQTLVYFNVGNYFSPDTVTVTKAQLWFANDNVYNPNVELYSLSNGFSWAGATSGAPAATWNNTGGGLNTGAGGELETLLNSSGQFSSLFWDNSSINDPPYFYYELSVSYVQDLVDQNVANNGFALKLADGVIIDSAHRLTSMEHGGTESPTLVIWTSPIPEPSAVALSSLGVAFLLIRRRR